MTATEIASLQLEGVNPIIAELLKSDFTLESSFTNVRAKRVGTTAYRLVMKYGRPGHAEALNLETGSLALGSSTKFNKGTITPAVYHVPVNFTELVKLVGVAQEAVGIKDVVTDLIADVTKQVRNWNDILLQTNGKGDLAISNGAIATNTYTCKGGFGARLLAPGLSVDVCRGDDFVDSSRKSITVDFKFDTLGTTQTFNKLSTDLNPATVAANDIFRFKGLTTAGASPAPVFIYGLPYYINATTAGAVTVLGIQKDSAPYVVSNSIDLSGAQVTQPVFRALINTIQARLEGDPMSGGFFHTHRSQVASYEELGFPLQTIPMAGGQAPSKMDLFFGTPKGEGFMVNGFPIKINDHADNTKWHYLQPDSWGKVYYGDSQAFWYPALPNSKIYPIYDGTSGTPKTQFGAAMVVTGQFYTDNMLSQGVLINAGLPVLN